VVTTYTLIRRSTWPADVHWRIVVVLDEAQAIKNSGSAQSKSVRKLKASGRIALTGTPVENQLGDLWSLFDFCVPGIAGIRQTVSRLREADDKEAGFRSCLGTPQTGAAVHPATHEDRSKHCA
jgi:SNF2 family DNA or RNA helicase